jgi:hypothetical protein
VSTLAAVECLEAPHRTSRYTDAENSHAWEIS